MPREIHFPAAALAALAQGRRIEAIKLVREANPGLDLRAAMQAADAHASGRRDLSNGEPPQPGPAVANDRLPAEAVAAISRGQLIEAIKIVRESHGLGLKEAKDRVDRYRDSAFPQRIPTVAAGDGRAAWWWIAILLVAAACACFWLA